MKFYKTTDINFYINVRNKWDEYCRYSPDKTWSRKIVNKDLPKTWKIFIDLEGAWKQNIEDRDLYFNCWQKSRIEPKACLPLFYALGKRFIKLEKAGAVGYKCSPTTMNLKELREKKKQLKAKQKRKRREAKFQKKLLKECQLKHAKKTNKFKSD